jgi:hypothetical protein
MRKLRCLVIQLPNLFDLYKCSLHRSASLNDSNRWYSLYLHAALILCKAPVCLSRLYTRVSFEACVLCLQCTGEWPSSNIRVPKGLTHFSLSTNLPYLLCRLYSAMNLSMQTAKLLQKNEKANKLARLSMHACTRAIDRFG